VNKKKLKKYNLKRLKCILAINKKILHDIKKRERQTLSIWTVKNVVIIQ